MEHTTVAIIGAGASALTLAQRLKTNKIPFIVIDKGNFNRDPNDPHNIANGFGGAALYSDGKLSFKPAGTGVWNLPYKSSVEFGLLETISLINKAYFESSDAAKEQCRGLPISARQVLASLMLDTNFQPKQYEWTKKEYVSIYIPLETRLILIKKQYELFGDSFIGDSIVHEVETYDDSFLVKYQPNGDFVRIKKLVAKYVVVCGGRFAPMFLKMPFMKKIFKRVEIGVRLSSPAIDKHWAKLTESNTDFMHNDPKYVMQAGDVEFRTFCCCIEGQVVESTYNGLKTLSGRSDRGATGESNIGFNMRVFNKQCQPEFEELIQRYRYYPHTFKMPLRQFLDTKIFGSFMGKFVGGLQHLNKLFDIENCDVSGPCIEGCGEYWNLDTNLRDITGRRVWVAGDSSGIFRGLCAAMVSGTYIAEEIMQDTLRGSIVNQVYNDQAYLFNAPVLKGTLLAAMYEIHIFLTVNPSYGEYIKYKNCVTEFNETFQPDKPMKACYLSLDFDKGAREVTVLQSARYVMSDDLNYVISECHKDANFFAEKGFDVIREKVEVSVYGVNGLPTNEEEYVKFGRRYFEFHLRVRSVNRLESDPLSDEELGNLRTLSSTISNKLGVPVPLSFNKAKSLEGIYQRFLNVRLRNVGVKQALNIVETVCEAIYDSGQAVVEKRICEYVIYDSYVELDKGWID